LNYGGAGMKTEVQEEDVPFLSTRAHVFVVRLSAMQIV